MTTPPQGQNPFAQGQNPYGQQPAPQGVPQQQSPYINQGGAPVPPPAPARSKFKLYKNIAIGVIAVAVIGGGYIASRDDANTAAVGDCMSISNEDSATNVDLEVVDCGDSKAKYKVAEKKDGSGSCDRTKYAQYNESGDGESFTLCLTPLK
ncbi:LppU/SCO3897 family protein [Streptomyces indicus]|uniref:Uncharacterized protein n=1 Tax=Streptomyces indicus TaxID=417292 RepID=A0A1G9F0H6_9ACTN|nr:hypothetical protein [Streptomyces indicus]SDK81755.1 hypothetical protein SAMN05421806_112156 [Streptomyces indicus]